MEGDRPLKAVPAASQQPKITSLADFNQRNAEAYFPHVSKLLSYASKIEFLVPGAIPRGNIVVVSGAPFSGKTWAMYDLARAVASGTKWLGRGSPCTQGPVMILNYDQPTETMAVRVRDIGITAKMPVHVHTFGLTTPPSSNLPEMLYLPANDSRLKSAFEHIKPVLIIVDSFRQSNNLDENSNKDMAMLMAIFKRWQRFNNTTIALIHHMVKDAEGGTSKSLARGSGEISASADVELAVSDESIKWTKSRSWPIGETKQLKFTITDSYADAPDDGEDEQEIEIIKKVNVRATTHLPGELEADGVAAVMKGLEGSGATAFNYGQIRKLSGLDEIAFKKALRNCRVQRLIRYVRTQDGAKVYRLAEAAPPSA
jgi:hypothetical protein